MESIRLNNGWISMTACSVEGCGRANYAKGLCAMHYQMVVMHSCDNPPCVNPMHLRVGTQSENIIEAFIKGRKFTPQQLARMRANSE